METKLIVMILGIALFCTASPASSQENAKGQESNSKSLDVRSSITKFAPYCPPGLWCGKKRGLNQAEKSKKNRLSMIKNDGNGCPPGIWCGKKRQVQEDRFSSMPAFERPQNQAQNIENVNPMAEEMNPSKTINAYPENFRQGPIGEKLFRRFQDCPPGLWCGKKRSAPSKLADRSSTKCPPGLWCGK